MPFPLKQLTSKCILLLSFNPVCPDIFEFNKNMWVVVCTQGLHAKGRLKTIFFAGKTCKWLTPKPNRKVGHIFFYVYFVFNLSSASQSEKNKKETHE